MRDYTQPHPGAIFKDKPTCFIVLYKISNNRSLESVIDLSVDSLTYSLECTRKLETLTTIALFIIKPKKP